MGGLHSEKRKGDLRFLWLLGEDEAHAVCLSSHATDVSKLMAALLLSWVKHKEDRHTCRSSPLCCSDPHSWPWLVLWLELG